MTERVTRKAFKNGGSVAVRIPKGWIDEDSEIDIVRREDGIVEIRPLDRDARMKKVLQSIIDRGPISDVELPIPARAVEPERYDWNELWNGKMP
jgi:virulence-associated protein VagC